MGEAVVHAPVHSGGEHGIDRLVPHVSPPSVDALRLYERVGFRRTAHQPACDPSILEDETALDLIS